MEPEEAAVMDSRGIYRILFVIITPLLKSSIATVSIMTFLNNWNEFMMASTYLSSPKWKTLPFSVLEFTGQFVQLRGAVRGYGADSGSGGDCVYHPE